jgi:hypothetical protein
MIDKLTIDFKKQEHEEHRQKVLERKKERDLQKIAETTQIMQHKIQSVIKVKYRIEL